EDAAPAGGRCPACRGTRLNEDALAVRLAGKNIAELCALPVKELTAFLQTAGGFAEVPANAPAAPLRLPLAELLARLGYLNAVEEGGRVVYQGPPDGVLACEESPTGAFLSGRRGIAVPSRRRDLGHGTVRLVGARTHNLRDLTVDFPLGVLCVVTGVSGAGKSALVQETLYPALRGRMGKKGEGPPPAEVLGAGQLGDVVLMDQAPLGR